MDFRTSYFIQGEETGKSVEAMMLVGGGGNAVLEDEKTSLKNSGRQYIGYPQLSTHPPLHLIR